MQRISNYGDLKQFVLEPSHHHQVVTVVEPRWPELRLAIERSIKDLDVPYISYGLLWTGSDWLCNYGLITFENGQPTWFLSGTDFRTALQNRKARPVTPAQAQALIQHAQAIPEPTYLDEMDKYVGMEGPKSEVVALANMAKFERLRRQAGLSVPSINRHLIFAGGPGTGKTTFARFIGQVFRDEGILPKGDVREVGRDDIVGTHIGQTEERTKGLIEGAYGGILFIDEFPTLAGEGNDFGLIAINVLNKALEDKRDRFVCIIAGYEDEIKLALAKNPGFRSRFSKTIRFPDYTPTELLQIFAAQFTSYTLSDGAEKAAALAILNRYQSRGRDFANAREMRTLFEACLVAMASRVMKDKTPDLMMVQAQDVQAAAKVVW